jgi:hypothetical protein
MNDLYKIQSGLNYANFILINLNFQEQKYRITGFSQSCENPECVLEKKDIRGVDRGLIAIDAPKPPCVKALNRIRKSLKQGL